jgi:hypothetical protein
LADGIKSFDRVNINRKVNKMKKDDNKVVDPELEGPKPKPKPDEENDDDESGMFMSGSVMVVHSPQELFELISKLTGGSGPSQEEISQMIHAQLEQSGQFDQIEPTNGEAVEIEDPGVDVWGPAFRNDPRDAHVYKGQLTPMMRSVFDRIH